ncbi:peptide deformylase [Corynebacterium variabile]|uniref:Peptide deformylase n=1 Tax=Corynebacterium variabile TaxID=1727 RepID=A0A3C0MPV2_9CORY|nr:peptide deformylase [Corynebacterium variabile]MDN6239752.1 peptide deformylase [Corynebacterium variabile]MDN6477487.1 peptide deformylase [Corynebacterium variabile]MDN6536331.1 peptide deformylase [Corynebacterium variabile]MDN6675290.1 peptide deformylase [Corynebacterium variabile]MDN6843998.1 peptide deformylase [Corynebacterium variabile]
MTALDIRLFGDPVLRTVAENIDDPTDPTLRTLVEDMYETMDAAGGVGLAANQVGVTRRVFVYDCDGDRGHIVNPVWEAVGAETQTGREGCLSVPDAGGDVTRAATVHLTGVTVDGEEVDREVTGLMARCVQHETDHLDGVMYFQRMEPGTRREVMAGIRGSEWFNR